MNGVRYAGEVRLTTSCFKTGCKIKFDTIVLLGQNLSFLCFSGSSFCLFICAFLFLLPLILINQVEVILTAGEKKNSV